VTFDNSLLTAAMADLRWSAVAVAALSGLVRGFSGFGSALIYMPLVAAIYEPRIAAVTLLLIDFVASAPFALREVRNCTWREVLPIYLAAAVAIPVGTLVLKLTDPVVLRWCMALLVLSLLAILLSGWRYHGRPRWPVTIGVGLFSGFSGGAVQVSGPAVIMYWLGTDTNSAATVRANMMVYFLLTGATLCVAYFWQGLISAEGAALALFLGIPFVLAMVVGATMFRGASDLLYRRIAYGIVAVAAIISLPLFDELLR
jgi:uncharacterized membrane protein YfcA